MSARAWRNGLLLAAPFWIGVLAAIAWALLR